MRVTLSQGVKVKNFKIFLNSAGIESQKINM